MIPLFRPFLAPDAADEMKRVLDSGYIGQGRITDRFEKQVSAWTGTHTIVTNSGTAALTLAYDLADIGPGDYVIASPMSCLATFTPLAHLGAMMLWADCDPRTGLIDPADVSKLLKKFSPGVKAIVAIDYGGRVPDMPYLRKLADDHECSLIEDAAHAFGAYGLGHAHYTCYSFQAIKTLTTIEGGALALAPARAHQLEEARSMRWFGLDRTKGGFRCEQTTPIAGYKFNMVDPNAAVGLANLPHIPRILDQQRRQAAAYESMGLGHASQGSSNWLYITYAPDRESFCMEMEARGIQCARPHSRCDVHPFLMRDNERLLPGVTEFDDHHVCLPNGWWLDSDSQQQVIDAVLEVL